MRMVPRIGGWLSGWPLFQCMKTGQRKNAGHPFGARRFMKTGETDLIVLMIQRIQITEEDESSVQLYRVPHR